MTEKKKEQTEKDFEYEKLISDDELVYNIRMSNFIKFDKNPFRFNENGKKVDFDSNKDENGNFVLRWRNNFKNDKFFKESNSRFVEWSDGSKQLVIGTKAFNVSTESLPKKSYLFLRKEKDKHILLKSISKQLIVQSTLKRLKQ
ncbi:hypothetical protein MHBO_001588 [Bonamia ostreae]|uniref:Uncharacterized protein n=1 Tax=Bonamia ostreae TaxID=126728 RepID=A0ABV2AJJ4_9EUKA